MGFWRITIKENDNGLDLLIISWLAVEKDCF